MGTTGQWLARKQGLPTVTTPFRTEQEIGLFLELLPQHESARGKVNYEGLAQAFNARVTALIKSRPGPTKTAAASSTGDKKPFDVYLKTAKYVKEYCSLLKKRMILQNSCAEWIDKYKSVRRALRDDSFCSWCPAKDQGSGHGRPAQHEQQYEQQAAVQRGDDGGTVVTGATSVVTEDDASKRTVVHEKKKRAPKCCQTCKMPLTFAPRGYAKEAGSEYHTRFGWCPTSQKFISRAKCKLCDNIRAEDSQYHKPDGYCERKKGYVSNWKPGSKKATTRTISNKRKQNTGSKEPSRISNASP